MRCPYPDCQKDYNDASWPKVYDNYVNPIDYSGSLAEQCSADRVYIVSRRCRFCHRYFHEISVGHPNRSEKNDQGQTVRSQPSITVIGSYPTSKTKFQSKAVPQNIRDLFNEAERCRSIGAMTGVAACLRKTVYTLCDDKKAAGSDYREKIGNLPISGDVYKDLLKQIKFLGDNGTKPGGDSYSPEQIDVAIATLPVVIDKIYEEDEKIAQAQKVLALARTKGIQGK